MRKLEIHPEDMVAVVGPGILKSELAKVGTRRLIAQNPHAAPSISAIPRRDASGRAIRLPPPAHAPSHPPPPPQALAPHGLLFGPDPSSNPSLGGMASTGGSGMTTLRYGTTRENVVSLEVVTPDGWVLRTRQNVRKSSTGYELNQLYMGSEGTLGIITELVVRLLPAPSLRAGSVVAFPAVRDATRAVVALLRAGAGSLRRCELLNAEGVAVTNLVYGTKLPEHPTLFLEFAGDDLKALERDAALAKGLAEGSGALGWQFAADGEALDELWDARRGCYLAAAKCGPLAFACPPRAQGCPVRQTARLLGRGATTPVTSLLCACATAGPGTGRQWTTCW